MQNKIYTKIYTTIQGLKVWAICFIVTIKIHHHLYLYQVMPVNNKNTSLRYYTHEGSRSRDGTGSRVTGSAILAGSILPGHGSVCQTRYLTRFGVLTCAFIVELFLQSNTISANQQAYLHNFMPDDTLKTDSDNLLML